MEAQSHSFESAHTQPTVVDTSKLYQEGLVAGTIGAATLAVWFLILDLLKGHLLYTPLVLGTALFQGSQTLANPQALEFSLDLVVGFTFVHWLVFAAVGCIASRLLGLAEQNANFGFGVLLLFVVFEFGFVGGATLFAEPVLHALTWPTMLIGNLISAGAMALSSVFVLGNALRLRAARI
ncbi:MAG: hypothetical protein HC868_15050 [Sphingomonadales bacterium]|nr:hypothetical protein [Sphingomonadales bacterium]